MRIYPYFFMRIYPDDVKILAYLNIMECMDVSSLDEVFYLNVN